MKKITLSALLSAMLFAGGAAYASGDLYYGEDLGSYGGEMAAIDGDGESYYDGTGGYGDDYGGAGARGTTTTHAMVVASADYAGDSYELWKHTEGGTRLYQGGTVQSSEVTLDTPPVTPNDPSGGGGDEDGNGLDGRTGTNPGDIGSIGSEGLDPGFY